MLKPGKLLSNKIFRFGLLAVAGLTLISVFIFQRFNYFQAFLDLAHLPASGIHPYIFFIVNKTVRLVINDIACFMIILAIFRKVKYLTMAWYVFLLEALVLLPVYFGLKLYLEGDSEISSPLLSQIHRIIVNPTLMILLIIGFVYQNLKSKAK